MPVLWGILLILTTFGKGFFSFFYFSPVGERKNATLWAYKIESKVCWDVMMTSSSELVMVESWKWAAESGSNDDRIPTQDASNNRDQWKLHWCWKAGQTGQDHGGTTTMGIREASVDQPSAPTCLPENLVMIWHEHSQIISKGSVTNKT